MQIFVYDPCMCVCACMCVCVRCASLTHVEPMDIILHVCDQRPSSSIDTYCGKCFQILCEKYFICGSSLFLKYYVMETKSCECYSGMVK